jgi:hypothetical protein
MDMKANVSKRERSIRVIAGIVFLLLASNVFSGVIKTLSFIVGIILLLTGAIGFCPLYTLFKRGST